ncbi:hypothetical protein HK103_006313 [Boothiomyces macroporosus]|uniref:RRM domain-containing protein n=1 Tax=Boothiomyces macroporosus TaxID=261099 RepID=A0AAD5Y758_9FUNG|nr:hypothetical protein HK103_006313 [Boothiomyces macroporosus]
MADRNNNRNRGRNNNNNNNNRGNRPGGRVGRHEPYADNRKKHERPQHPVPPSRTLFVRNVQFDTLESEIRTMFEPYGEIKTIFDLIPKRGLVFVTFYDIRSAVNSMAGLNNVEFKGRKADIHYSLPKEGDREQNQGSVNVELVGSRSDLLNQDLYEFMSKFGEIQSIRDVEGSKTEHLLSGTELTSRKKIVSFFDSRCCPLVLDQVPLNNKFKDGQLLVSQGWDEGHEELFAKQNSSKDNDRRRDNSPARDNDRRRDDRDKRDRDRNDRDRDRRDSRNDSYNRYPPTGYQGSQLIGILLLMARSASSRKSESTLGQNPAQLQQLMSLLSQMPQAPLGTAPGAPGQFPGNFPVPTNFNVPMQNFNFPQGHAPPIDPRINQQTNFKPNEEKNYSNQQFNQPASNFESPKPNQGGNFPPSQGSFPNQQFQQNPPSNQSFPPNANTNSAQYGALAALLMQAQQAPPS